VNLPGRFACVLLVAFLLEGCALHNLQPVRNVVATTTGACSLGPPPADALIVQASVLDGRGISSSAVNNLEEVTTVAYVDVEPGKKPIYLILRSVDSMVWLFRGATERVTGVALITSAGTSEQAGAGLVGISPTRVHLFHSSTCSLPSDWLEAPVRTTWERAPDLIKSFYTPIATLRVPSGVTTDPPRAENPIIPEGVHAPTWRKGMDFYPLGVVQVDPASVVGAQAVSYDLLPRQFGLAQLVGSGHLEYAGGLESEQSLRMGHYRIVRPIARYPIGMGGSFRARFLAERGIPEPAGDLGHSCVIFAGTDKHRGCSDDELPPSATRYQATVSFEFPIEDYKPLAECTLRGLKELLPTMRDEMRLEWGSVVSKIDHVPPPGDVRFFHISFQGQTDATRVATRVGISGSNQRTPEGRPNFWRDQALSAVRTCAGSEGVPYPKFPF
jgi:hypothetical protein